MNTEHLTQLRHSAAHLLAAAVLDLYPNTKLTIGPAIESGFYYDFDLETPLVEKDLQRIDQKMRELIKSWDSFTHREVTEKEAKEFYKDNEYKLELIDEIVKKGEKITFYKSGEFEDLCRGGHSENPKKDIGAFKLLSIAGAYWRGDEKNTMLTRIYGTAFSTKEELSEHLNMLEEAKKRDHRKIGPQLELFKFEPFAPGSPFWYPKGMIIFKELEKLWRDIHEKNGYQEISTPIMVKNDIFKTSGHWDFYKHNMFNMELEDETFSLKPMNCPESTYVYASTVRSYKDLPLRFAEIGRLHRREKSGQLGGLLRVIQITMDDAHIYTSVDKMKDEIDKVLDLVEYFYKIFNFKPKYYLSTRPEKYMGERELWDAAELRLENALKNKGLNYELKPEDGAFYGPKIDIEIKDVIGRNWQLATIQLDFQMPKRFKLEYVDSDGTLKNPVMIHRAIFGSFERFIGILIEHFAGAFPLWLAPVQISLLPIADRHNEFAEQVNDQLQARGIRSEADVRSERLQAKIRDATLQKVPFMGIIGDKEIANGEISIRKRNGEDLGNVKVEAFLSQILEDIDKKV